MAPMNTQLCTGTRAESRHNCRHRRCLSATIWSARCLDAVPRSTFARVSQKRCSFPHFLAETPGVSQCYDAQGRSAGKVVADKSGNTIVYNDKDVPIGTGSVRKISDRSYEVC